MNIGERIRQCRERAACKSAATVYAYPREKCWFRNTENPRIAPGISQFHLKISTVADPTMPSTLIP